METDRPGSAAEFEARTSLGCLLVYAIVCDYDQIRLGFEILDQKQAA
jgi:hypothetical protein